MVFSCTDVPFVKFKLHTVSPKVSLKPFQRLAGPKGSALGRPPQWSKLLLTSKEFLFLVLFLLDKGEKVEKESGILNFIA